MCGGLRSQLFFFLGANSFSLCLGGDSGNYAARSLASVIVFGRGGPLTRFIDELLVGEGGTRFFDCDVT